MPTRGKPKRGVQAGMTIWHRIQRSWPFLAVGPPINSASRRSDAIATAPSPHGTPESIKVDLERIKQGSFDGHSAAILRFEVSINPLVGSADICFEIRVWPTTRSSSRDSTGPIYPYFGAYGPAHISDRSSQPEMMTATGISSIDMFETKRGLLLHLRTSQAQDRMRLRDFRFAVVVVYANTVILTIIPSTSDKRRARIFQRTWLYPLILEPTLQSMDELVTCAQQGDDACHATCNDFGPEHLTTARWHELLSAFSLSTFDADAAVNTWVHRVTAA